MSLISRYFLVAILLLENYSLPKRFFPALSISESLVLQNEKIETNQDMPSETPTKNFDTEDEDEFDYDEYCLQFQTYEDGSILDTIVNASISNTISKMKIALPRYASIMNQDFSSNIIDDISWHNGIIYSEAGEYSIEGANITMLSDSIGLTTNDFTGLGAAVGTYGEGVILNINNTIIETSGVAKVALIIDGPSVVIMTSSTIITHNGTVYDGYKSNDQKCMMVTPPWVIGLGGPYTNLRSVNILGNYSVAVFVDTTIQAAGWGALSTDESQYIHLYAINTKITVANSGYGAFLNDDSNEEYFGVYKNVESYLAMVKNSNLTYKAYRGEDIDIYSLNGNYIKTVKSNNIGQDETVYSKLISRNFGFNIFCNQHGYSYLYILDGTDIETEDAIFLVKSSNSYIIIDNSTLKSKSNVLLQILDNEDEYIGIDSSNPEWGINNGYGHYYGVHTGTKNSQFIEPEGYSNSFANHSIDVESNVYSTIIITNAEIEGNIWDSSGYIGSNPATTLNVTLDEGATLSGVRNII